MCRKGWGFSRKNLKRLKKDKVLPNSARDKETA